MSSIQNANVSGVAPPETKYTKSNAFNIDGNKDFDLCGWRGDSP